MNWLFGLDSSAQILDVRLLFVVPLPYWVLVFVFIAIVWHCRRLYRREMEHESRALRYLLTTLRAFTWCAVVFVVLQPRIEIDLLVEPKSNLAILIDDSTSMTLVDQQSDQAYRDKVATAVAEGSVGDAERMVANSETRSQIVSRILNNKQHELIETLGESYALHFFRFSENVEVDDPVDPDNGAVTIPEPTGHITQLGLALRNIPNRLRGLPMAGIVAFTDGANNKGEDPELSARMLGRNNVPVFPVGIGAPQAVDVQVVQVDIPDLLFKDDEVSVRVTMKATGLDGIDLPIELTMGGKEVGKGHAEASEGVFVKDIVIKPEEVGDLEFIASVPQQQDEHFVDNNSMKKRVRVIDSAIRILIVCDTPSWEYRYLKGFLDSDERIETKVFLRRGDLRLSRTNEDFLERFPTYDELKTKFDCIILNNIGADYFAAKTLQNLQDYVAEEGGALIMIASTKGTPGTFINTPIGEMMPVSLERINEDPSLDLSDTFSRGFKLNLTREGRQHIITRLEPLPEENARLWQTLPDQYWYYNGIRRLKPTATSLVEHATARNSYGPIPLMAVHNFGRGQVLFLGFNTWRWRYRIGNRLTNRFWGQTIQYMGLPHLLGNMKRVNFLTEARDFVVGERIPLTARVLDVDFQPVNDASVELIATERESGNIDNFTLGRDTDKEGVFTGPIFLKEGTWEIQVVGLENEETLVIDSKPPHYEYMQTAMQEDSLQQIAEISGGRYVSIEEVGQLPDFIRATSKKARTRLDNDLWDTLTALLCIVIAASIEWVIRRRIDLP